MRRGNLDLHLMYKALFELSSDRVDFVSRLFARKRPDGLTSASSVQEIFAAFSNAETSEALFAENLKAILDDLTKTHGFVLTADDPQGIEYVYRNFQQYGPGLTYWMSGRGGGFGRNSPSYADLMLSTDEAGVARSYLSSDENFAVLKGLETRNLLIPVVGNFAGPKAIRAVASFLRDRHAVVSAFYLSNVEQYLNMDGLWATFCSNVATLPLDDSSRFIRSVRQGHKRVRAGPLLNPRHHVRRDQDLRKPDGHHAAVARTAIARTAAQNVSLTASCMMRASPGQARDRPDRGRVGDVPVRQAEVRRVEHIEDVPAQRRRAARVEPDAALQRHVEALKARSAQMVAQLVAEGARRRPAGTPSMLNHWSTVSGPFGSPVMLGRPVMLVPTLLLLWLTVNGRPERDGVDARAASSRARTRCWPSGSSTTKLALKRWRTS